MALDNISSYTSYPDSTNSSPHSREIDSENQSWDEQPSNNASYKVKFMCSYGGKIQPRPHDNQLAYVGGDTKILSVDRNSKFTAVMAKLTALYGGDGEFCFKYQLPGEDLDALISVTNDEDLEHMMLEYDRLYRGSAKPARLRLFLFPLNPPVAVGFGSGEPKSERQWFFDVLNSVKIQNLEGSSPTAAVASATNPDFLFGLDKVKLPDYVPPPAPTVTEVVTKDVTAGSDCGSEDRHAIGESVISPVEIQRQIQELQRLQIANNQDQGVLHRQNEESNTRAAYNSPDYFNFSEKVVQAPPPGAVSVQMQMPATYYPERHIAPAGYHVAAPGNDHQQVYFIPASAAGLYQPPPTLRQATGPPNQQYYGVQRVVQEVYRDQQSVYSPVPATASVQQPKIGAYTDGISVAQPKTGVTEPTYVQVGYDSAGRQVYYTTQPYQAVPPVAASGGPSLNQDGKVIVNGNGNGNGNVKASS